MSLTAWFEMSSQTLAPSEIPKPRNRELSHTDQQVQASQILCDVLYYGVDYSHAARHDRPRLQFEGSHAHGPGKNRRINICLSWTKAGDLPSRQDQYNGRACDGSVAEHARRS